MPTLDQLNALANDVPQLNQRAAAAAQTAASTKQQQAIQQTNLGGTGVGATAAAQGAAAGGVDAQVKPLVAAQQQTTQDLSQIGQTGVQVQQTADQAAQATQDRAVKEQAATAADAQQLQQVNADLAMRKRVTTAEQQSAQRLQAMGIEVDTNLQFMTIRQRQQLAQLGGDVQEQIQTNRLKFERDDMGRKFTDQRQLEDYITTNAKTDVDFKQKMQTLQETSARKIQMMEIAEQKIRDMVQNSWQSKEQQLNNEEKAKLIDMSTKMQQAIRKAQAEARNHTAAIQAGGTIIGAVVGGIIGNAPGAVAGAAVGGGLGTVVAGTGALNPLFGGEGEGHVNNNPGPAPSQAQPSGGNS